MTDIRERFGAFDRVDMPDLWDDAQHREPRPAKGSDHERIRKGIVIATALALTVATTGVLIRSFDHGKGAQPVTGSPAEWPTGIVKALEFSFRYPPQWRLQPFAQEIGTIYFQGVLVSNTDLTFHHPTPSDGGETSAWDLSELPADGVVISIEHISGGPPPEPGPPPADTALPLSLSDAKLLSPQPDPLGFSPKPAGTEERYLDFVLAGKGDTVRVFFAPDAPADARAAAADVVASIARMGADTGSQATHPLRGIPKVVHASRMAPTSGPGILPVGAAVPSADIGPRTRVKGNVIFALADQGSEFGSAYPAISIDRGRSWRIAGPRFSYAAAQGASVVDHISSSSPRSAVAWGLGGNLVRVTRDAGATWYQADFVPGMSRLRLSHGVLLAQVTGPSKATAVYVSRDSGLTWTRVR